MGIPDDSQSLHWVSGFDFYREEESRKTILKSKRFSLNEDNKQFTEIFLFNPSVKVMFAPGKSIHIVILVALIWFLAGAFYYLKWNKGGSEATISWDVSGYKHYLPAIFIYKDLKEQSWMDTINKKYLLSPAYDQAFVHE